MTFLIVQTPFNKKFSLDISTNENDLIKLLSCLSHIKEHRIKGLCDMQGHYFTFTAAIKNPQGNFNYGKVYSIIFDKNPDNYDNINNNDNYFLNDYYYEDVINNDDNDNNFSDRRFREIENLPHSPYRNNSNNFAYEYSDYYNDNDNNNNFNDQRLFSARISKAKSKMNLGNNNNIMNKRNNNNYFNQDSFPNNNNINNKNINNNYYPYLNPNLNPNLNIKFNNNNNIRSHSYRYQNENIKNYKNIYNGIRNKNNNLFNSPTPVSQSKQNFNNLKNPLTHRINTIIILIIKIIIFPLFKMRIFLNMINQKMRKKIDITISIEIILTIIAILSIIIKIMQIHLSPKNLKNFITILISNILILMKLKTVKFFYDFCH